MKHSFRKYLGAALLMACTATVVAQEFRTSYFMQTSNFRHQMNPALLDEAYFGFPFLGNINIGATGNIGAKNFIYKLKDNPKYEYTTFMNPGISASKFLGGLHDKNRGDVYVNYNIFSLGFKAFKGINLIELNVRSNTNVSLPYELFDFIKQTGAKEHYTLKDIGMRTQNYAELALGHSHKVNDKLTVGAKMKFLFGMAYADFSVDKLDVTMNGDHWAIEGDAKVKAAILDGNFEHDYDKPADNGRPRVDGLDIGGFKMPGFGMAFDFGATYKVIDGLTLSVGLTDLGFIGWKNTLRATSKGSWDFDGFEDIKLGGEQGKDLGDQFEDLGDDLEEMFGIYDDGKGTEKQALAATLNIGAEYTLPQYDKLRFGFLYTSRIHGLYSFHQGMFSAAVRPVKCIEATVNTAVSSTGWTVGGALSLRAKHFDFYVGTDRFFGKLSKQGIPLNNCNANVTLGMTFPL